MSATKNRIQVAFDTLKQQGRKALIPFITAGDPGLDRTVPLMHALVAGAPTSSSWACLYLTPWPTAPQSSGPPSGR